MKSLILLCICFSSLNARSTEITFPYLLYVLNHFSGKVDLTNEVQCNERHNKVIFENCSDSEKKKFEEDYDEAIVKGLKLSSEIEVYLNRNLSSSQRSRVLKVKKKVSCINKKMSNISAACKTREDIICERPNGKRSMAYAAPALFGLGRKSRTISLCPGYFEDSPREYRAAVVIHELSHHCGADDHEYFSHAYSIDSTPKQFIEKSPFYSFKMKKVDITHTSAEAFEY